MDGLFLESVLLNVAFSFFEGVDGAWREDRSSLDGRTWHRRDTQTQHLQRLCLPHLINVCVNMSNQTRMLCCVGEMSLGD